MTTAQQQAFAEYFERNYPAGTVISDPSWHVPRIFRAVEWAITQHPDAPAAGPAAMPTTPSLSLDGVTLETVADRLADDTPKCQFYCAHPERCVCAAKARAQRPDAPAAPVFASPSDMRKHIVAEPVDAPDHIAGAGKKVGAAAVTLDFPIIRMGLGEVEVGDAHHEGLPALWFGRGGRGLDSPIQQLNRPAHDNETLALFTFADIRGLEAIENACVRVRAMMTFANAVADAPAVGEDAVTAALSKLYYSDDLTRRREIMKDALAAAFPALTAEVERLKAMIAADDVGYIAQSFIRAGEECLKNLRRAEQAEQQLAECRQTHLTFSRILAGVLLDAGGSIEVSARSVLEVSIPPRGVSYSVETEDNLFEKTCTIRLVSNDKAWRVNK